MARLLKPDQIIKVIVPDFPGDHLQPPSLKRELDPLHRSTISASLRLVPSEISSGQQRA